MQRECYRFGGVTFAIEADAPIERSAMCAPFHAADGAPEHTIRLHFDDWLPVPPETAQNRGAVWRWQSGTERHLLEQYGIGELCLTYTIDGQPADISAEFDGRSFYEAMRHGAVVQTSMVTPDAARREMEPHLKNGDDVLYIGLSSGVSGTCWGVGLVAKELAEEYPDRKIRVLNSRGASLGEGLIVLAAAKLAAEGRVIEEIEVRCEELCGKMRQHFMVDELKFLRKGGRISGGAALAGTLLQIKPILEGDEEGKIVMLSKVRGKKAGIEELVKLYDQMVEDRSAPVGISHAGSPADALVVATKLRQVGCTGEILTVCHEPVTGAHVGPGMLAVYFYSEIWR